MNLRKWYILAVILFGLVIFLALCRIVSGRGEQTAIAVQNEIRKPEGTEKKKHPEAPADYSLIASNNLFHPLRGKPPSENSDQAGQKKQTVKNLKFELRGVYRSGNQYGALIEIAGNRGPGVPGELRRANANLFLIGSEIAEGYMLKEVMSNRVVIERNGEKVELALAKLNPPEESSELPVIGIKTQSGKSEKSKKTE